MKDKKDQRVKITSTSSMFLHLLIYGQCHYLITKKICDCFLLNFENFKLCLDLWKYCNDTFKSAFLFMFPGFVFHNKKRCEALVMWLEMLGMFSQGTNIIIFAKHPFMLLAFFQSMYSGLTLTKSESVSYWFCVKLSGFEFLFETEIEDNF